MIQAVFTIGIVLTVVMVILGFILAKAKIKGFVIYYPFLALFIIGLLLLLFATILERTWIMGAGLGGWGIACVFASAISFITTTILDAYAHNEA
ncbi:MAG TPA: hypothetical protein VK077_06890 [Virgibacillus sp.]|nr:hypothetical protein [Virgibacillus sp.]